MTLLQKNLSPRHLQRRRDRKESEELLESSEDLHEES